MKTSNSGRTSISGKTKKSLFAQLWENAVLRTCPKCTSQWKLTDGLFDEKATYFCHRCGTKLKPDE